MPKDENGGFVFGLDSMGKVEKKGPRKGDFIAANF